MEGLVEQLELLPELLSAHLSLTLLALFVATAVSVPLGIASTRIPTLERFAVGTASVIQTVPGLAMLAMMVPLLAALGASGIGYLPAIIGLTLYCIFPILMGTITGLKEVDPAMIEAARVICEDPPKPLQHSWSGAYRLDNDVQTVVGKALEKEADRRYGSAVRTSNSCFSTICASLRARWTNKSSMLPTRRLGF